MLNPSTEVTGGIRTEKDLKYIHGYRNTYQKVKLISSFCV